LFIEFAALDLFVGFVYPLLQAGDFGLVTVEQHPASDTQCTEEDDSGDRGDEQLFLQRALAGTVAARLPRLGAVDRQRWGDAGSGMGRVKSTERFCVSVNSPPSSWRTTIATGASGGGTSARASAATAA